MQALLNIITSLYSQIAIAGKRRSLIFLSYGRLRFAKSKAIMRYMSNGPKFFEDFAKAASGAASALAGIKEEIQALARQQAERILAELEVTPREEFEAVRDMAAKARVEQEKLEKRVAKLEALLKAKLGPASPKKPRKRL